jgi:predicted dehydrogenase
MENGATITLESSWAINMLDTREAITTICGTKAGADMLDGLRINGIRQNLKYTFKPDMSAKGAAFYDGRGNESPADREARLWIEAIINDTDPFVLPEEAYVVTQILEGIYISAKTGDIYKF